jgi:pimeloyl-ACP methyl ester carboxylesterase
MKTDHVMCLSSKGFHRLQYYDWGDPSNPRVVICVHGLTRSGRDFDFLAAALASDYRVVCPDMPGRGMSDWLESKDDYSYLQYMSDLTALIARVSCDVKRSIYWVGTSMGALLGIAMAATPKNPIEKLVANDAGMIVPRSALQRLSTYVGHDPRFDSLDELVAHVRHISAPFGALTDAQWRHLTVHCAKQHRDGAWGFRYDPAIAGGLNGDASDIDLTAYWDAIRCPTLILRGADSDILLRETAEEMTRRGPGAKLVEFPAVGHAPMLLERDQIAVVREFLDA